MNDSYDIDDIDLEYTANSSFGFKASLNATYQYSKYLDIGLTSELHSINQLITTTTTELTNNSLKDKSYEVDKSILNLMLKLNWKI